MRLGHFDLNKGQFSNWSHPKAAAFTKVNAVFLFWVAFIFTRPFGATFGNFLTKEHARGGLELGTLQTSAVAVALLAVVVFLSNRFERPRAIASSRV